MSQPLEAPPARVVRRVRVAVLVFGALAAAFLVGADVRAPQAALSLHPMPQDAMSDAAMARQVHDWYAAHPARGLNSSDVAADTFLVTGVIFNSDGKTTTSIDTARIQTGQTILWSWVTGIHTTTNGTGALDPAAGTLWDQSITSASPSFSFTFTTPGSFPFFCRVHESLDMRGVVIVTDPVGVPPAGGIGPKLAFVNGPAPNPTAAGARFEFSLPRAARVRADLFDAAGQRVATVFDRDAEAGVHSAAWDGRMQSGRSAAPGIYLLRLSAGGATVTREITVVR